MKRSDITVNNLTVIYCIGIGKGRVSGVSFTVLCVNKDIGVTLLNFYPDFCIV